MKEARFFTATEDGVQCLLCPHHCRIMEGCRGLCRSRECLEGKLYALSYGKPCALAIDPVEKEPLQELLPYLDAANIDIKAMDDAIYCKYCGATLAPVLENILTMHTAGVHVEITNLLVTGLNDSERQITALCRWMLDNSLQDVPLHFSRFFPRYRFTEAVATPKPALLKAFNAIGLFRTWTPMPTEAVASAMILLAKSGHEGVDD